MRTTSRILIALLVFIFLLTACNTAEKTPAPPENPPVEEDAGPQENIAMATPAIAVPEEGNEEASTEEFLTAVLAEIEGSVLARSGTDAIFEQVDESFTLKPLGQVQTKSSSKVRIDFSDNTIIRLGENSLFTLGFPENEPDGLLYRIKLEVGEMWIILGGGVLEVETLASVAAVRGSYMYVDSDPETSFLRITCLEGDCSLSNEHGTVLITAGETALIMDTAHAPETGLMTDEDIQDWLDNNPEAIIVIPALTEMPRPEGTTG